MLLQKTPADKFTVTTKLRFTSKANGQMGGLIMMGLDYSALVVRRTGNTFELVQLTCKAADKGQQIPKLPSFNMNLLCLHAHYQHLILQVLKCAWRTYQTLVNIFYYQMMICFLTVHFRQTSFSIQKIAHYCDTTNVITKLKTRG